MNKVVNVSSSEASLGTSTSYIVGFVLSVFLTVAAYLVVVYSWQPSLFMAIEIVALGFLQLMVQLIFFLHMDRESSPRWNLTVFLFALVVVVILVAGSIWIMQNLNYHGMPTTTPDSAIIHDEGIRK